MRNNIILIALASLFLVTVLAHGQSVNDGANTTNAPKTPTAQPKSSATKRVVLDRLDLDTSRITGAREQPKVTAIVPWKAADAKASTEPVFRALVNEALRPIDRDDFVRETAYFLALKNAAPKVGESNQTSPSAK